MMRWVLTVVAVTTACALAIPLATNDAPVIGILTVPLDAEPSCVTIAQRLGRTSDASLSCATAFYPKFVEGSGARAVWIPYNANHSVLDALFNSINGILFTGGGVSLTFNSTYLQTAQYLFNKVLAANDANDFFPLHGTCMGFQVR